MIKELQSGRRIESASLQNGWQMFPGFPKAGKWAEELCTMLMTVENVSDALSQDGANENIRVEDEALIFFHDDGAETRGLFDPRRYHAPPAFCRVVQRLA